LEYNPCGVSANPPDESRIVGGSEARPHSLPWHVSIQFDEHHICAGILIDDQHIVTAAHCFQLSLFPIQYTIVLGAHLLSDSNRRVSVNRLAAHDDYNVMTLDNDIGLMRLTERIQSYSDNITPACLARSVRQPYVSHPLIVAGWGATLNQTSRVLLTDELRQTILTVMSDCSRVYKNFNVKKQVCVGTEDYSSDSCDGDSGGGLFQKQSDDKDRWILTGIVSYGNGCAEKGYPGVYVRVSAYYDWIQKSIEQMK
jgi:secreted trypsin-like serine protease